jgi:hypothetical protein
MPELIQPGMMRDLDAISQMLSAKVTLADLIGASTKINSLKTYTEVFEEIWSALRIDVPLASLLESSQKLGGRDGCLYELFERRHALVHEIGIAQVGSYILRDNWTFEEATTHGRMIVDVISKIEKQISKFASDDFPNKLDDSGYRQDRRSVLERQIEDVENRIAAAMESTGIPHFDNARNSSAHNLKVQLDFLDAALIEIPKRHYDPTPGLVAKLYRQRLEFLSAIAAELGV